MKEGHLAYLACSSVIMESLVERSPNMASQGNTSLGRENIQQRKKSAITTTTYQKQETMNFVSEQFSMKCNLYFVNKTVWDFITMT